MNTIRNMQTVGRRAILLVLLVLSSVLGTYAAAHPQQPASPQRFLVASPVQPALYVPADNNRSFKVADLDGDEDSDVLFVPSPPEQSGPHDFHLHRWINSGDGTFVSQTLGITSSDSFSFEMADLDGDTDIDLVTTGGNLAVQRVFFNDGSGLFTPGQVLQEPFIYAVNLVDLNGDTFPDLVGNEHHRQGAQLFSSLVIWLNNQHGEFIEHSRYATINYGIVLSLDIDGDRDLDLVLAENPDAYPGYPLELESWLNDGSANFSVGQYIESNTGSAQLSADVTGDGAPDLITAYGDTVYVRPNMEGDFSASIAAGYAPNNSSFVSDVSDVDQDGDLDLLLSARRGPGALLINNGSGQFMTRQTLGREEYSIAQFANLNQDQWPDVVRVIYLLFDYIPNPDTHTTWLNAPQHTVYAPVITR